MFRSLLRWLLASLAALSLVAVWLVSPSSASTASGISCSLDVTDAYAFGPAVSTVPTFYLSCYNIPNTIDGVFVMAPYGDGNVEVMVSTNGAKQGSTGWHFVNPSFAITDADSSLFSDGPLNSDPVVETNGADFIPYECAGPPSAQVSAGAAFLPATSDQASVECSGSRISTFFDGVGTWSEGYVADGCITSGSGCGSVTVSGVSDTASTTTTTVPVSDAGASFLQSGTSIAGGLVGAAIAILGVLLLVIGLVFTRRIYRGR